MRSKPTAQRRATVSFELLLISPILLGVLLAVVEMSMIVVTSQQLAHASAQGARVAAQGGGEEEVVRTVRQTLGDGVLAGAQVETILTDPQGQPLPSGQAVVVWVSIPATEAVPDLLRFIGFTIKDETLLGRTVMRKE